MSREQFGPMGAMLPEADLARVLAAIGAFYPRDDIGPALVALVAAADSGFAQRTSAEHGTVLEIPVRVQALQSYVRDLRAWNATRGGPKPWTGPLAQWKQIAPPGTRVRFRIDVAGSTRDTAIAIDLAWLARILGTPAVDAYGVYVAWPSAPLDLTWEWPLRIGVPQSDWSAPFREALDRGRLRALYTLTDIKDRGSRCDLLLLPASLRDAMRAAMDVEDARASAVIVVGGTNESAQQTEAWLESLRHQFRSGAVAIAHVPTLERACWFDTLLAEISHNATLDMAMTRASRGEARVHFRTTADGFTGDLTPPLVAADRMFIDRAVMVELARRIGSAVAALPQGTASVGFDRSFSGLNLPSRLESTVNAIGKTLAQSAERVAWHHETGDATVLAQFRGRIEEVTGAAVRLPSLVLGVVADGQLPVAPPVRFPAGDRIRVMPPLRLRPRDALAAPVPAAQPQAAPPASAAPASPAPRPRTMRGGRRERAAAAPPGPPPAPAAPAAAAPAAPAAPAGPRAEPPRPAAPLPAAAAAAAPEPDAAPTPHADASQPTEAPQRSVLIDLFTRTGDDQWASTGGAIAPRAACALDTFIGLARAGVVVGPPLDERSLPLSATGHGLTLVFTPLWRGDDDAFAPAQTHPVHLPPAGDSTHVTFYFAAPADLAQLRARIVVLFGFRVLQTLMLDAATVEAGAAQGARMLRLQVENLVSHDLGERTEAPSFDAALIVNDNPEGVPGITGVGTDGVAFVEPEGLDTLVEKIRDELKVLNQGDDALDEIITGLDDERVQRMLRGLAARGAMLTRILKSQPQFAPLLSAQRIQVVDARRGAYLPVEFFYDGKAPLPTAGRCENAIAALDDLRVHASCAHNRDANFYCPAAFWGFSRCIERQPVGGQGVTIFRQPQPGANTLRPLAGALLAASRRVRDQDLDPPDGVESVLAAAGGGVVRARSWEEWQRKIGSESPSLLVLLAHSLDSPDFPGVPALEISGTNIASVNLEREFVSADPARSPIVLLLGCSTALPRVPFLNFVGEFKDNGAALVIGTIATIRGRQTGAFVRALMAELRSAAAGGDRTFDEVFLRVKQRLLAGGDPFVLSVLAYGDTGWRIQA